MWKLKGLVEYCSDTLAEINGKWVPARPLNYKHRSFSYKLRESWAVFSGKAEAFTWPEDQ